MTVDGDGKVQIGNYYSIVHNYAESKQNHCLADLCLTDPRDDKTRITSTSYSSGNRYLSRMSNVGRQFFEGEDAIFALSQILASMLCDPNAEQPCMAIGALDECESGLEQLLRFVVQCTSISRAKWIVSGHWRHEIEQHLRLDGPRRRLSLEINAPHATQAVNFYIYSNTSLVSLKSNPILHGQVRDEIHRKADGTLL